jgi:hypothetical protein
LEAERIAQLKAAADAADSGDDAKIEGQLENSGGRGRTLGVGFGARDKRKRWSVCGAERRGDLNLDTIWEDWMVSYSCHTRGLWVTNKPRERFTDEGIPSTRCWDDCKAIHGRMPRFTERGDWRISILWRMFPCSQVYDTHQHFPLIGKWHSSQEYRGGLHCKGGFLIFKLYDKGTK